MTRAEQLDWWRRGYEAGHRAGRRDQAATDLGVVAAAVRHERQQRQRELLGELIAVLATAMLGPGQQQAQRETQPADPHAAEAA